MSKTFLVNPLLELELKTSDENLMRLFEIRFSGLFSSSDEQGSQSRVKVRIQEVPHIHLTSPRAVQNLGLPDALCLFNEQSFVIVRDKRRIKIPFLEIGQSSELNITFETGFPVEWLRRYLNGLIAFHLLGIRASLYHAACIVRGDCEIIIPAWRGTGKTTLAFQLLGDSSSAYKAEDEFVLKETGESYVHTDASHVDYKHMDQFPAIKRAYPSLGFGLRSAIARMVLPLVHPEGKISTFVHRGLLRALVPKVYVKLKDCIPDFRVSDKQPVRRVVLQLISQQDLAAPVSEPIDVSRLVERTVGAMQYEREDIYAMYYAFVYATGKRNCVIDNAVERETQIVSKALEKAACYEVRVPAGNRSETFSHIKLFLQQCI